MYERTVKSRSCWEAVVVSPAYWSCVCTLCLTYLFTSEALHIQADHTDIIVIEIKKLFLRGLSGGIHFFLKVQTVKS